RLFVICTKTSITYIVNLQRRRNPVWMMLPLSCDGDCWSLSHVQEEPQTMPRPAKSVAAGLRQKGFQPRENDHTFYHLYVSGKKTIISTKISHGEKEIGDKLLGVMARQV